MHSDQHVSLTVCVPVFKNFSKTTRPIFTVFFLQVTYGRGSVLFWLRCDTLCTSGFVDDNDAILAHTGPQGYRCRKKHHCKTLETVETRQNASEVKPTD